MIFQMQQPLRSILCARREDELFIGRTLVFGVPQQLRTISSIEIGSVLFFITSIPIESTESQDNHFGCF